MIEHIPNSDKENNHWLNPIPPVVFKKPFENKQLIFRLPNSYLYIISNTNRRSSFLSQREIKIGIRPREQNFIGKRRHMNKISIKAGTHIMPARTQNLKVGHVRKKKQAARITLRFVCLITKSGKHGPVKIY